MRSLLEKNQYFQSNTLSDDELLSLQTTIRDGKKQSGRTEEEPLVFYKKDRNTLENRKDIVGDAFEQMCQYIFTQQIIFILIAAVTIFYWLAEQVHHHKAYTIKM